MFEKIINGLTRITGRTGFAIAKRSPEILLITGIVGGVGATVLACRATLKADEILEEHRENVEKINDVWERVQEGKINSLQKYEEQDYKKDLTVNLVQTGVKFAKVYWPAVTLGAFSIFCIVSSHGIMKQRNLAIMAAYKAVEESYKAYRKRVIEEHGEEADYMYKNGLRKMEVTELAYTDEETGEEHPETTKELYVQDKDEPSMYARFFDETCRSWTKDAEYNFFFLKSQQDYWNNILIARGHVFLNEVYDALGIPRTQAGTAVGWVCGKDGVDNRINFGIFDSDERTRAFVNGHERSILLDFNVDGVIWNKI
jgi:hypothetical protein